MFEFCDYEDDFFRATYGCVNIAKEIFRIYLSADGDVSMGSPNIHLWGGIQTSMIKSNDPNNLIRYKISGLKKSKNSS